MLVPKLKPNVRLINLENTRSLRHGIPRKLPRREIHKIKVLF